jgi:hypothetical protein
MNYFYLIYIKTLLINLKKYININVNNKVKYI